MLTRIRNTFLKKRGNKNDLPSIVTEHFESVQIANSHHQRSD